MKRTQKLGILFLHHDTSPVAENNLQSVRKHNPNATIVTLSAGEGFPGGYNLSATPEIADLHTLNPSRGSDWLVISWFLQRKEYCDKWWIIEWDTFCRTSAEEYYRPVWDFPFVASSVLLLHRDPGWHWFSQRRQMPKAFRDYVLGGAPFLYLISEEALIKICKFLLEKQCLVGNGELRFCTAANRCGFAPCGFSPPNDRITHIPWTQIDNKPAIFHPVKHYVRQS